MNTKKWLKASMVALLLGSWSLPTVATANVVKAEDLDVSCSGGCVDVWQVDCKDKATTFVAAKVKDPTVGNDAFVVTTIGYKGPTELIGQADQEFSPFETTNYSLAAWIKRPGNTHAATSAMVKILSVFNALPPSYNVEFSCRDFSFAEVGNPTVTLLQDQ